MRDQYKFAGPKRVNSDMPPEERKPIFRNSEFTFEPDLNPTWMQWLQGQRTTDPVVLPASDQDLIYHLKLHAFCQPRSLALVNSLKQKAIKFLFDFDMKFLTMESYYRTITQSVMAALIVDHEEKALIDLHLRYKTPYTTAFTSGQLGNVDLF